MINTAWYIEKAKQLDSVTRDLRIGNPLKHKIKLAKIDKASDIMNTAFTIGNLFGRTKETDEAQNSAKSLIELYRNGLIKEFNRIHQ